MAEHLEPALRRKNLARRAGLILSGLLIVLAALLVLGAFVPSIPYLGVFGSVFLSLWPAWLVVAPLTAAAVVRAIARNRFGHALIVLALLTAVGASVVTYRLISLARANGVSLTAAQPFGFSGRTAGGTADESLVYTRDLGEALTLRIYRPTGQAPSHGWPVLMYIHGGGWIGGSSKDRSADMRWFASRGRIVLAVDYSLSSDRRHLWDRVIDQIGCAMAWTDANIAARGGDPSRLALIGESAGGNLVLNAAYLANAGRLRSSCGGRVPQVSAVSAVYPGVDLVAIHDNPYPWIGNAVRNMASSYVGGSPWQFPGRFAAVGSATHINPAAPPTLLFITENDHLVPLASMRAFEATARQAGVKIRTVSVPHAEHGFDATGIGNVIYRQVSLRFINEHDRRPLEER